MNTIQLKCKDRKKVRNTLHLYMKLQRNPSLLNIFPGRSGLNNNLTVWK